MQLRWRRRVLVRYAFAEGLLAEAKKRYLSAQIKAVFSTFAFPLRGACTERQFMVYFPGRRLLYASDTLVINADYT
jgi:hypothetical protein